MFDFMSAQAWVNILAGVAMPFIVKAVKWGFTQDADGKLALGIAVGCSAVVGMASHFVAQFFAAPPSALVGDMTAIFALSQIVYQTLKDHINL